MTSINDILPPEILFEVFYHTTARQGALELHGALLACRLWHDVALKEPRLWTVISVDKIFLSRLLPMPFEAARRFAQQCVDRSGRLPMHVFINTTSFHTPGSPSSRFPSLGRARLLCAKIDAMMDIAHFNGHSSRLETLVIYGVQLEEPIIGTWILHKWKLPLRRLELHRTAAQYKTQNIPSLTSVAFINPIWAFNSTIKSTIKSTKRSQQQDTETKLLTLQRSWIWFLEDLLVLRGYQALTALRLISNPPIGGVESRFHSDHPAHDRLSVLLPSVNILSLTGEIPHEILGALNLPALVTVEIRNHGSRHSMKHLQNTTLHHSVATLEVLIVAREALWWTYTCDLAAVLTATLKLQTLVVSPSMLSHLPHASVLDMVNLVVRQS